MRGRPDARQLLEQARRSLLQEVLDQLPADERYTALMIANAMAIAAREVDQGAELAAAEHAGLEAFFDSQEGLEMAALDQRLAEEIRGGRHDGAAAAHGLLHESAVRRLRIANPKALRAGPEA